MNPKYLSSNFNIDEFLVNFLSFMIPSSIDYFEENPYHHLINTSMFTSKR